MRTLLVFSSLMLVWGCANTTPEESGSAPEPAKPARVEPPTDFDGEIIEIDADHWVAARIENGDDKDERVVLMFHQAGSNMHEYDDIAPRIAKLGYDCVKVDQRAGGEMWSSTNVTATQYTGEQSYMDAYEDMKAVFTWAVGKGYTDIVAWGSSYSASLVLKLAAENPLVSAVVSFSPGEYFGQPGLVAGWNSQVKVPRFFAATSEEMENGVLDIYMASPDEGNKLIAYGNGVHGSSALLKDKDPDRYKDYWKGVEEFFESLDKKSD